MFLFWFCEKAAARCHRACICKYHLTCNIITRQKLEVIVEFTVVAVASLIILEVINTTIHHNEGISTLLLVQALDCYCHFTLIVFFVRRENMAGTSTMRTPYSKRRFAGHQQSVYYHPRLSSPIFFHHSSSQQPQKIFLWRKTDVVLTEK